MTKVDLTCLDSTQAWAASSEVPTSASAAAMTAYIQRAMQTDTTGYDPVCGAALDAYIEAYLGGASEEKATEAAGKAFVSAVDVTPDFKMDSHCGKAAQPRPSWPISREKVDLLKVNYLLSIAVTL